MKLRHLFILNTILASLFSLGFLLLPELVLGLFGFPTSAGAKLLGRLIGVELVVGALVTFFARDSRDSIAKTAIILSNMIASVIGIIVSLAGILSGAMNSLGWVIFAAYLLLAVGFGYFQFRKPQE